MIPAGPATRVFLVTGATDMRKGFDGLFGIVSRQIGQDPLSGHVFVFCNRSRDRIKLLFWDGSGLWLCTKRLERGRFSWDWPAAGEAPVSLGHEQLAMLLGGLDPGGARVKRWYRSGDGCAA